MKHFAASNRIGRDPTPEDLARIHNGGPNGYKNKLTVKYWEQVKKHLCELIRPLLFIMCSNYL